MVDLCVSDPARIARRVRGQRANHAGRAGEAAARRDYEARGGAILAERWRCAAGEIDLIVQLGDVLVFVEVKAGRFAPYAISERQWLRLEAAATQYTLLHQTGEVFVRFDAALVGRDGTVEIIENARMM